MSKKPKYLQHYLEKRCDDSLYSDELRLSQASDLIIVIPCYKENWQTLKLTLDSLAKAKHEELDVKILILVNYKESDLKKIINNSEKLFSELQFYAKEKPNMFVFLKELKGKHKGVGLARKLLMDAAFLHYTQYNLDGIVVNLDADSLVQPNYYQAIYNSFESDKTMEAASIDFHHIDLRCNPAILNYEFHLNYFIQMQRWVGLPFAYQTIGSAMAVRTSAYAKQSGMNLRQAGEDFYFLQKYTKTQGLRDVYTTTVMPSGRESDRVPFGTGKAVLDFNNNQLTSGSTYNPKSFVILKKWLQKIVPALIKIGEYPECTSKVLASYLLSINAKDNFDKIIKSSSDSEKRISHFFIWFDAFLFFKYLHHCRDEGLEDIPNEEAAMALCNLMGWEPESSLFDHLKLIRRRGAVADYHNQWRAGLMVNPSITSAS